MHTIGKDGPPARPSVARRMAMMKARYFRRERAKRRAASRLEEAPQAPQTPIPEPGNAAVGKPAPWSPDTYAVERAAYARRKPELLREAPGKYVVFAGEAMIGPFDDQSAALLAGYRAFGIDRPLYFKQVLAEEPRIEAVTIYEPCPS